MTNENEFSLTSFNARISQVKISGLQRTYNDYVENAVKPLFSCKNFNDVITETKETRNRLLELGIFKNVNAFIDVSPSNNNGYEVTFNGQELQTITGSVGTEIAPQEGCFVTELSAPNLLGRGERVTLNGSYSNLKNSEFMLKYFKPLYHTSIGHLKPDVSFSIFRHTNNFDWSKFKSENYGLSLHGSMRFPYGIQHSLRYENYIREVFALNKSCPLFVRDYCGPSLGNLLSYTMSIDKRNSSVFASEGCLIKNTLEIVDSSIKNVGHLRNELHLECNQPLFSEISLQMCARIGKIISSNKCNKLSIADMFFMGGPQTLRGFCTAGMNEHEDNVSLGAKSYWICSFHIWSKLPFSYHFGNFSNLIRLQLFYNMGQVNSFNLDNINSAVGAGLALKLGDRARIEFNYCVPLRFHDPTVTKKFQFGIGYDFL